MKKVTKKRKELSKSILLILILLFSVFIVCFGICIGFLINSFINEFIDKIIVNSLFTLIVGVIYFTLLFILMRNKDIEKKQPLKWYVNYIFITLIISFIISAITIIVVGPDDCITNFIVGFCIFPLIGIISTPNVVNYAIKDTQKWKQIFYKNGNLDSIKNSKDYYRVKSPVSFEDKILLEVYKHQILNILVVIGIMILIIFLSVNYMINDNSYTSNTISNIMHTRSDKSFGFIFFMMIIFLAFGIPIVAYYITNALRKIRVVRNHDYIAYHAIVSSVKNSKITIYDEKKHYTYKYCTCVGIKEKNIHCTPAILIFVPDDVILFPDNDKYRVEKYKNSK